MLEFEEVSRSFACWIVQQKRYRRLSGLFLVGVNGTIGQGKTVFSLVVAKHLNALLKPEEGQVITRSLDDYYLPKAERYRPEFLARGYNPEGIPNRGPAGTHDTAKLWSDIGRMEKAFIEISSSPAASGRGPMGSPPAPAGNDEIRVNLPAFDKQTDDRSPEPFCVAGKVGVFILEGWFVGARTDVDPTKADPGLRRSVAAALKHYKSIFDRLDALWVFDPPRTLEEIVAQRIEQQETSDQTMDTTGLTPSQIRRFIDYFYKDSWQSGLTSPTPPRETASFWADTDRHHRFIKIEPPCP